MKPLPALHCPTVADKLAALKVIYANGWRWAAFESYQTAVNALTRAGGHDDYPYILLVHDRIFYIHDQTQGWGSGPSTLVNSPAHLASYCLTLGDRAPKVFTPAP